MRRRAVFFAAAALATWLFLRPRVIPCPQCRGNGAPPIEHNGEWRARICATCGASATPDLPLMGEPNAAEVA